MAPPTYPVLSADLFFPGMSETEKAVQASLLRIIQGRDPNIKALSYEKARRARKRGQRLYECRLHRSGLSGLKEEQRDRVMALARSGAQIAGPLTVHQVDEWAATVHRDRVTRRHPDLWRRMIAQHRGEVERVADALLERRELDGATLAELLAGVAPMTIKDSSNGF